MEENSELEEGEAHYYKNVDYNIDPDTDLSYIDEKVQIILGHHLKDFEGGFSAENLGAKFGGYGSFLPTYERSPSTRSCPKSSQEDSTAIKSLHKLSTEGPSKNLKPALNAPPSVRLGTSSCSDHSLQNLGVPSGDVSASHNLCVSSDQVANKFTMKDERLNKSGHPADQRTLRFRIKMSSDKVAQKKAAIYSGLGLDNSPSSSRESADESGGINPLSRGSADESPTSILQAMTSFPVHWNVLISPLHDSLLRLMRNETLSRYCELISSHKDRQDILAMLAEESVSCNGKLLKENRAKLEEKIDRLVALKDGVDMKYESGATLLVKEIIENEASVGKKICSKDSRCAPLPNSVCTFDSVKGTGRVSEVSREADKNEERYNLVSSNLPTEEVLGSMSGKESGKSQKESDKRNLMGKVQKQRRIISQNNVLARRDNEGKHKGNEASAPSKAHSDGSRYKEDTVARSKQHVGKKPSIHVEDETDEGNGRTKPSSEGKKSKGNQTNGKVVAVSIKESLTNDADLVPKGTMSASHDASTCKSKMLKLKSQKDVNGARDFYRECLDSSLEQTNNLLERPSSNKPKLSSSHKFGVKIKHKELSDKSKENFSGKKADDLAAPESFIEDDSCLGICTMVGERASEMVPAATGLQDNWVLCDICQKWRLLPFGITDKDLPHQWLCSMQNWLPGLNRCDISEDETTKAIYALYQLPVPAGQLSVQENANGTASVITSVHGLHLEQNHQNVNFPAVSIRGMKKHCLKEKPKAGGNGGLIQTAKSAKTYLQDSVKSRSLDDMNQPSARSNIVKTSSSLYSNKSCYMDMGKHVNGGDVKKLKMKKKRDADQHGYGTSKKAKIKDVDVADKHRKSDVDLGRVKNMLKYENSFSEDVKCDTNDRVSLTIKKLGDEPQISLERASLDMRVQDKRENSVKKRNWQGNQNGHDSMDYTKEEKSESEFGRGHKSRVKRTDGKCSSANKGADSKSNKNSIVAPVLSGCKVHPIDGIKDVRSVDKDHHLRKLRRRVVSQQISDGVDSMRCREVTVAATSSCSKVSGSCKSGTNFKEVKGSPVESVSSSPFRSFYKQTDNTLRQNAGGTDFLPVNCNPEKRWDGEGNGGRLLSDGSTEKPFIPEEYDDANVKLCASTSRKVASQQKPLQDFEGVIKANQLHIESVSHCVSEDGQNTRCDMSVPGSKQERVFDEVQTDGSYKIDVLKASTHPGNMGNGNGACFSLGHCILDLHEVKGLNASSMRSMSSLSHNAANALKEAQELKDYADRIKKSGFVFECNEAYFQAALKFLHGALLLEICSGEGDRHGEMTQIQVYSTVAKLCEFCAREYEKHQDMAAAALAYKCMEVAYMRVVYCKHSSTSRDRNELQASLNMTPQGESPSSSASDLDNLNNQATDKANLCKGTVSHVNGNHGIVARNGPQFGRLFDFTQDVNFAMEASRKALDAFASANVIMGEAQNRECITTVKRVIDFSFQDVEALIRLVRLAMESIKPLRFSGARN